MPEATRDPRAWTAAMVDRPESWYHRLTGSTLALLDDKIRATASEPRPLTELRLSPQERSALGQDLESVRHTLEDGRGFVILDGLSPERYSPPQMQAGYWFLGQALGVPFEQNVQGTLLYGVRDTGQSLEQGARFSVTSYESSFHTDNSFGETVLDVVGLLCVQTARSGGVNQIVSACSALERLRAEHPDALAALRQPFHIDRRGGVRPGEGPTIQLPVVEETRQGLVCRYLRYWIEAGHQKAGVPLTPAQVAALDGLDEVLRRPELRAEFALQRGQMLFLNNRWLLHNRTAFEDHPELERRRHLVRLWLRAA